MIATNRKDLYEAIRPWLPVYEGFFTYGGMSSKEIEAMAVGIREMTELEVAGSSADAIKYFVGLLLERRASRWSRPPAAWPATLTRCASSITCRNRNTPPAPWRQRSFITSGIRGMERGSVSMDRDEDGNDVPSDMELLRLAVPRRVFTMSHFQYAADRLKWLYDHRTWSVAWSSTKSRRCCAFSPARCAQGRDWGTRLAEEFEKDFGPDC